MLHQPHGRDVESHEDKKQSNGMLQIKSCVQCVRSWRWVKRKFIGCSVIIPPFKLFCHVEQRDVVEWQWVVFLPHGEWILFSDPMKQNVEKTQEWSEKSNDSKNSPERCHQAP